MHCFSYPSPGLVALPVWSGYCGGMGIKDFLKGNTDAQQRAKFHRQFDMMLGDVGLVSGSVLANGKRFPVAGVHAEFEPGDGPSSRTTMTRVAAGAVIAGPVGAIIGGIWKKDTSKVYVVLNLPDESLVIADVPASKGADARRFVNQVNTASKAYGELARAEK